ncbi:putative alpha-galactosidase C precursor [Fusarium austroafricanum]|uniref:Alpha-galactosidase n=1 Tax=Fusarium austroafricanum TaxID=2364996 RepID=A0A8H4KEI5_9HYPO|nr:putative alpha-galactosidase C precursor [Fusarium austroafricanum]
MVFLTSKRLATVAVLLSHSLSVFAKSSSPIQVDGTSFALNGDNVSYRFHVDNTTGDLINDHYGGPVAEDGIAAEIGPIQGWVTLIGRVRREFPDHGRGDFRIPAFQLQQASGTTVTDFRYKSHDVVQGKPGLPSLPSTFGEDGDVSTLVVHMYDNYSSIAADLSYSIFPKHDAIVRSVNITNRGNSTINLRKVSSWSVDLQQDNLDLIEIKGDWAREGMRVRRKVDFGTQGFQSSTGYSSHLHNPFLALVSSTTTEAQGEAWGFSLVYTGSFAVDVEKSSQGLTRATLGLNPLDFSWPLKPGQTFTTPEVVSVFSDKGVGGMSRQFHRLYKKHLMKTFAINETSIYKIAKQSADLGIKLFVMDDGWFGNKYPRVTDNAGLGDWQPNKERFPEGLTDLVDDITKLTVANSSDKLKFGIWFEPEMVNPESDLYMKHPDWALHSGSYPRTETRNQLVLNLALPEVQQFVIDSVSKILRESPISYVKWDNNRGIHETPDPGLNYRYMKGLYHVFETLTSRFPDVLWEGCASGGGRFDPGVLQWFPQIWTSDDTDAVERIAIQFGTSLAYPPSAMGAHLSHVPNGNTKRITSVTFRAHVAMMGGSFGVELDPSDLEPEERDQLPGLIKLAEKINPIVVTGDFYRLALPEETRYPAGQFISEDGKKVVLFAFQTRATINNSWPWFRLQGLDANAKYVVDKNQTLSGSTLMNMGIQLTFKGDYDSHVIMIEKQ